MPPPRPLLIAVVAIALPVASGCTGSIETTYTPSLSRLPQADRLQGIRVGIAKLEDRRAHRDVIRQGPRRFALTHRNQAHAPVANVIQDLFVEEFRRAGFDAAAVDRVLTKDSVSAMREAGAAAGAVYVLGGRIHVFEVVNEQGIATVTSRRSIMLELHLAHVASGALPLDDTVSVADRRNEGVSISHRTNVDRLMNTVFRQVVTDVVEKVAAKLSR